MITCPNGHPIPDYSSSGGTLIASCPVCNASLILGNTMPGDSVKANASTDTQATPDSGKGIDKTVPLAEQSQQGTTHIHPAAPVTQPQGNSIVQQTLDLPGGMTHGSMNAPTLPPEPHGEKTQAFPEGIITRPVSGQGTNFPTLPFDLQQSDILKPGTGPLPKDSFPTRDVIISPSLKVKKGLSGKTPAGYEILGELGRGAMGVVYKARQTGLKRLVALKMILAAGRASKLELTRFQIEAEAVAKLDHPNIVKIYEIGRVDDLPFFSLEFVSGGTLAGRIKAAPATSRQAAILMRAIAEGMDFAHKRGIVHRDLKPANILLSAPDQTGEDIDFDQLPLDRFSPKITDFGLAKTLEEDSIQTREGAIMGTPSYMAPEQALGKTSEVGPKSDIYGLGAILYDIVTGIPPFRGETVMDTIQQVIHREPVPPTRLNTKLPVDLGVICLKCLEKDPQRRYGSAGELAEDLRRYLDGEPIRARPTPWLEKAWKWARRKPAQAALALVLSVGTLGATVGGYFLAHHEKTRADENFRLKVQADTDKGIAIKQTKIAEENFRQALAAIEQLLTKVGQNRLAHEPRMERTRRELLSQASKFLARFLNDHAEDPSLQWQNARTLAQLGAIEEMLGNYKEAEKNLLDACQVLQQLHEKAPDNPAYLTDLADSSQALGLALSQQKANSKAQQRLQAAIDYRKKLPSNTESLTRQSATYFQLGQLQKDLGKLELSRQSFLSTVENLRAVLKLPGAGNIQSHSLAKALLGLAQVEQETGDFPKASSTLEEALQTAQALVDANPDNPDFRIDLALIWNQKGKLWSDLNPVKSEQSYMQAINLEDGLVADFPATPYYRQELASTLNNLGILLQARGNGTSAETAFEKSLGIRDRLAREVPWVPDHRRDLAAGLNNRGIQLQLQNRLKEARPLYEKALADLQKLVAEFPDTVEYSLELARTHLNESILFENLGQSQDADKNSLQSLEILEKASRVHPEVQELRKELAHAKLVRASLSRVSRSMQETVPLYEEAIKIYQELSNEFPEQTDLAYLHSQALINLGNCYKDNNRGPLAEKPWQEGREILEKLCQSQPAIPMYKSDLAKALNEWAIHLTTTRRADMAEQPLEKARDLQMALLSKQPEIEEYRLELAKTLSNLGMWAIASNLGPRAQEYFNQALKTLKDAPRETASLIQAQIIPMTALADVSKISGLFPEAEKQYRGLVQVHLKLAQGKLKSSPLFEEVARAMETLAVFLAQRNRAPEAYPLLQESLQVSAESKGTTPEMKQNRQLILAEVGASIGKPAEALQSIQQAMKSPPPKLAELIKGGTIASRCIPLFEKMNQSKQVEESKSLAIDLLQKSVLAGLADATFLKNNPDLEPLRTLPAFQEILKSVEMKKK